MKKLDRRLLAENIGSLAVLQAAGNYGHMVFAQAFAGYFRLLRRPS